MTLPLPGWDGTAQHRQSAANRAEHHVVTGRSSAEMVCDSLDRALPPLPLCPGYTLRTFQDGDEDAW